MFTKPNRLIDAACPRSDLRIIPVYHSTVPNTRKRLKMAILALASTVVGTFGGTGAAQAQTTADVPVLTAQQRPPAGRRGPPPPEAVAACADKPADSPCGIQTPDGAQIPGVCRAPQADAPAACVPNEAPPQG